MGRKLIDLVGQKFGRWLVESYAGKGSNRCSMWNCKCECGTTRIVKSQSLQDGRSTSCGCIQKNGTFGPDYTNRKFGRWTVLKRSTKRSKTHAIWLCRCECGNEHDVKASSLTSGRSSSCGCYGKEARAKGTREACTTHGMTRSPEYSIWHGMIRRCRKTVSTEYTSYIKKGIKVCQRWLESFENFFADMGNRPSPDHSLDRYPNTNGNYEPGNCRWATRQEQDENRGYLVEVNGKKKNIKQLARETGIPYATLRQRIITMKWPVNRAINQPVAAHGKKTHAMRNTLEGLRARKNKLVQETNQVELAIAKLEHPEWFVDDPDQP